MYARQISSKETYILSETEQLREREVFFYKIKQKILGFLALSAVVGEFVMAHFGLIDECGAFIIMLPLGLYLILAKERVVR